MSPGIKAAIQGTCAALFVILAVALAFPWIGKFFNWYYWWVLNI